MSKNRGYSTEFHLSFLPARSAGQEGLISEVRYPDGIVRKLGYDASDVCNSFVDAAATVWTREAGTSNWSSEEGETWVGSIEVVQVGTPDAIAGTMLIRKFVDGYIASEFIIFPIGIAITSTYGRDRTELTREVKLLNGRVIRCHREGRHSLWYHNGDIVHQPENVFAYAQPWRDPSVAMALA